MTGHECACPSRSLPDRMIRIFRRLAPAGPVWLLLLTPARPAADQPPRFHSGTQLVLVDVRVLRGGRPVKGLTASDFQILEEGVPQSPGFFQEVDIPLEIMPLPDVAATPARSTPAGTLRPVPSTARPGVPDPPRAAARRVLIMLFNTGGAGMQETASMQEAALRFLDTQFNSSDSAAVLAANNNLELLADLTSDREVLRRAIRRLGGASPEEEASLPDSSAETDSTDQEFIADETEFALFQTNQQLSTIQAAVKAFRDITGRKALIYFSTGLTSRGELNTQELQWTTDLCNKANLSLYPVDVRGLVALAPGGGAGRGGPAGRDVFNGRNGLNQLASLSQSRESLYTLAEETGGTALVDDNDLGKIFSIARQDSSHYYLAGYYVPKPAADGRFHKITVRLNQPSGLKLIHRPGYYGDEPYPRQTPAQREYTLLHTITQDLHPGDFPLEMATEYFPAGTAGYQVPVLLAFTHEALRALAGDSRLDVELVVLARGPDGITREGIRDQVELRPRGKENRTRFIYQSLLVLQPGTYQLTAFLRDNRTGLLARADCPLTLPAATDDQAGSLVLAGEWQESTAGNQFRVKRGRAAALPPNPLQVGGKILVPRVGTLFRPDETLFIFSRLSGSTVPENDAGYRVTLWNDRDQAIFSSEWRNFGIHADGGPAISARLPLNQSPPGLYRLEVTTRGLKSGPLTLERSFRITG